MLETLRNYNTQFRFEPKIINEHLVRKNYKQIVLCGMGGSHLPAGILKTIQPGVDIYVHRDYDLPPFERVFLESSLLVASSFSGNTAETLSFYKKAKQLFDLPVLCIATGGELLDLAKQNNDPYIELPSTAFVPRTALGLSTIALASTLKDKHIVKSLQTLELDISSIEQLAHTISQKIAHKVPVVYASNANMHLAYNWKIKFNETAKTMAFYNVFPEANHNEIEGYEFSNPGNTFVPVLLRDNSDDSRIQKRFDIFEQILAEKGIECVVIDITHADIYQKVFRTIVLGDFVTTMLAQSKGLPDGEVPLIESFKKKLV